MQTTSVLMCTCNRHRLLSIALDSLMMQTPAVPSQVVIVDNSEDANAKELVLGHEISNVTRLDYYHERERNIAAARNAALAKSTGDFVAFIDDDEAASPEWLSELHRIMKEKNADIVFGPVQPVFAGGKAPVWDPEGKKYTKGLHLPDGADAPVYQGSGHHSAALGEVGSCNVMMRRETCLVDGMGFNKDFGKLGGEDSEFFTRLVQKGLKVCYAAQAIVHEEIPQDRQTLEFMLLRKDRESRTYVAMNVRNSDTPDSTARKLQLKGLVQMMIWALPKLVAGLLPDTLAQKARFGFAAGKGKFFWRRLLRDKRMDYSQI